MSVGCCKEIHSAGVFRVLLGGNGSDFGSKNGLVTVLLECLLRVTDLRRTLKGCKRVPNSWVRVSRVTCPRNWVYKCQGLCSNELEKRSSSCAPDTSCSWRKMEKLHTKDMCADCWMANKEATVRVDPSVLNKQHWRKREGSLEQSWTQKAWTRMWSGRMRWKTSKQAMCTRRASCGEKHRLFDVRCERKSWKRNHFVHIRL